MRVNLPSFVRNSLNVIPGVNINPQKESSKISDLGNPAAWLLDVMTGVRTLSGENVTHETAMQLSAFFAAIRNISEDVAKLPFNIYERVPAGRKLRNDHPDFKLVHIQANPYTSQQKLQETLIHWALSFGNGYAEIVKNGMGQVVEMWPIHPSRVVPIFVGTKLFYDVSGTIDMNKRQSKTLRFSAEDIYHLSGLGNDGIVGYSVFAIAAQMIGKGLAIQNFSAAYFGNATQLSGVLENPQKLSKDAYDRMRESWQKLHTGSAKKKHKVAILEQGTKFKETSSNAAQAQLVESAMQTSLEVATLLRIPPPKIGIAGGLVKANFEAENISYYNDTLTPWITRSGHEMNRKVIRDDDFFAMHEVVALTLGDSKTRSGVIKTLRNTGMMSINEGRRLEGMNALDEPWADEFHMQSNITTVQAISEGKNLKQDKGGVGSKPTGDSGVSESQANDTNKPSVSEIFEKHRSGHMPNFKAAARRVMTKETKYINNLLKTMENDKAGYIKRIESFFKYQKRDIMDAFSPACESFISTFPIGITSMSLNFLDKFADNYAQDGVESAVQVHDQGTYWGVEPEQMADIEEKMAEDVINFLTDSEKGGKNEAE